MSPVYTSMGPWPELDWARPDDLEYMSATDFALQVALYYAQDLDDVLLVAMGGIGFLIYTDWFDDWQLSSELENTLNPGLQFTNLFEWASYNFVTTFIDEQRLVNGGRFGTGLADDLMIAGLLATEIVGYFDPTPASDVLNATLNVVDGNYVDGAISLAGALMPGGADKGLKAAGNAGGNLVRGMGDMASKANKSIHCGADNVILRKAGELLGRCFVDETFVVIDCLAGDEPQGFAQASLPLTRAGDSQTNDATLALWPATFVHWDHVVLGAGVVLLVGAVLAGVRRKKPLDDESTSHELDRLFVYWEAESDDSDDSPERDHSESLPDRTSRTALNPARRGSYPEAPLTVPNAVAASPMTNAADSFLPVAADDDVTE